MSKPLKVDEKILRDQIIRKSAVDNMTNISKQREDLKQGIIPVAPVAKSATDIAEDRTAQAGEAIQNLIDLGFSGKDAQEVAGAFPHNDIVAFNRAYPQIKTDFNSRFNIKNATPVFFIEYIKKYLEVLKASSGVPSNLGYVQDNLVTNTNDLVSIVLSSEIIGMLQNKLRTSLGMTVGSPLDLVMDELVALLPDTDFFKSLNLALADDPVYGYKAIQKTLLVTKPLPNPKVLDEIVKDRSSSNSQKLATLLSKLGTLTPSLKRQLRALKADLAKNYPIAPPPPPIIAPLVGSADVVAFITAVQALPTGITSVGKEFTSKNSKKSVPLCTVDGVEFYLFFYDKGGDKYGVLRILSTAPDLDGEIIKDKLIYTTIDRFITGTVAGGAGGITDDFTVPFDAYLARRGAVKSGATFKDYVKSAGVTVKVDGKRLAGAGLKKSPRAKAVKHHTGLKAIKLGKGFQNRYDPYKMYYEELKLTPISQADVIKKPPKKQAHTVAEGIEGDEYQKFDDKANRYIAFGKYAVNMRQLKKGVLQIVYKSLAPNPSFPSKKISSELQQYLFELLTNKKSLPALYKHVTEEEKKMFEKLAIFAGVFDKLNLPRINSLEDEKKEMDRFKLLHGEFVAGNDNVAIARELRNLILKFWNYTILI
jgi:Holliday junction resolvasome RuvABC DNA-binding subunit